MRLHVRRQGFQNLWHVLRSGGANVKDVTLLFVAAVRWVGGLAGGLKCNAIDVTGDNLCRFLPAA